MSDSQRAISHALQVNAETAGSLLCALGIYMLCLWGFLLGAKCWERSSFPVNCLAARSLSL